LVRAPRRFPQIASERSERASREHWRLLLQRISPRPPLLSLLEPPLLAPPQLELELELGPLQ
jgi:hypothetical protein